MAFYSDEPRPQHDYNSYHPSHPHQTYSPSQTYLPPTATNSNISPAVISPRYSGHSLPVQHPASLTGYNPDATHSSAGNTPNYAHCHLPTPEDDTLLSPLSSNVLPSSAVNPAASRNFGTPGDSRSPPQFIFNSQQESNSSLPYPYHAPRSTTNMGGQLQGPGNPLPSHGQPMRPPPMQQVPPSRALHQPTMARSLPATVPPQYFPPIQTSSHPSYYVQHFPSRSNSLQHQPHYSKVPQSITAAPGVPVQPSYWNRQPSYTTQSMPSNQQLPNHRKPPTSSEWNEQPPPPVPVSQSRVSNQQSSYLPFDSNASGDQNQDQESPEYPYFVRRTVD